MRNECSKLIIDQVKIKLYEYFSSRMWSYAILLINKLKLETKSRAILEFC